MPEPAHFQHGPAGQRWRVLFLLVGHAFAQTSALLPAPQQTLEDQVKAAFVLNFTKFVEWPAPDPPNPDVPFHICVLGSDPFGSALEQMIQGETVGGRRLVLLRPRRSALKPCQVLYVSKSEPDLRELLAGLAQGVLTVGEGESFTRDGGIIAFVIENRRVRFYVNLRAARGASLKVSSRLLSVAKAVEN